MTGDVQHWKPSEWSGSQIITSWFWFDLECWLLRLEVPMAEPPAKNFSHLFKARGFQCHGMLRYWRKSSLKRLTTILQSQVDVIMWCYCLPYFFNILDKDIIGHLAVWGFFGSSLRYRNQLGMKNTAVGIIWSSFWKVEWVDFSRNTVEVAVTPPNP